MRLPRCSRRGNCGAQHRSKEKKRYTKFRYHEVPPGIGRESFPVKRNGHAIGFEEEAKRAPETRGFETVSVLRFYLFPLKVWLATEMYVVVGYLPSWNIFPRALEAAGR